MFGKSIKLRLFTAGTLFTGVLLLIPVLARSQAPVPSTVQTPTTRPASKPGEILAGVNPKGISAIGEVKEFSADNLRDLVGASLPIFEEYRVQSAASRHYEGINAEVFQAKDQAAAFGLFTYFAGPRRSAKGSAETDADSNVEGLMFLCRKGTYLLRLFDTKEKPRFSPRAESLARVITEAIIPTTAIIRRPVLVDSLPAKGLVPGTEHYFLGIEALNSAIEHAGDMFAFQGDTEAVVAEYSHNETTASRNSSADANETTGGSVKLLIAEYHTPLLATDEWERLNGYVSSLSEKEQQEIIFKRTGNFIIAAIGVRDRDYAEQLVNSIEYPYTVKWLRNPLWPTNDPFRTQKAAEMLLSTFGLLGLIIITVIAGGTIFGTTIFLKRRKRQQQVFSDAGGMVRLDLDPFESVILGLPPKRSEE